MKALTLTTVALLLAACGGRTDPTVTQSPSPTQATTASPAPTATGDAIELEAEDIAFETSELSVAAGATVAIEFKNRDEGIPHNFAVYATAGGDPIFQGEVVTGDTETTYEFEAPAEPGAYPFQCDVHPAQMTGTLTVA